MLSSYIISPKVKIGVEDGILTRTSLVLTKPHQLCASFPFRHFDKFTDGESRTHITLFLKQVPLRLGYVGAKVFIPKSKIQNRNGFGERI